MITLDDLRAICPYTKRSVLEKFVEPLNKAMAEFEINNVARETAFLAQAAHESGGFNYMEEIASGKAYEFRKDLGNDVENEGVWFKGRGIFQLTGDHNYRAAGLALHGDDQWYTFDPSRAAEPEAACRIAGWFWQSKGLNELADKGDFREITRRINGGYNGWADRAENLKRAQQALA